MDGAVFPFQKIKTYFGFTSAAMLALTEMAIFMKGSAYVAGIYPHWVIGKIGIVIILAILKLILKKSWVNKNYIWLGFSGFLVISAIYLHSYQPLTLF